MPTETRDASELTGLALRETTDGAAEGLSEEALADLTRREFEATPAPWHLGNKGDKASISGPDFVNLFVARTCAMQQWTDRNFLVTLRNALPALLAEVDRLRAKNEALRNQLCQVHTVNPCDVCQRGYRLRDMETLGGRRLCVHCLKSEAERLMGRGLTDDGAAGTAEYGTGPVVLTGPRNGRDVTEGEGNPLW